MKERTIEGMIREDLESKMVFVSGSRQVGKTTLANMIGASFDRPVYLNWDRRPHRLQILREEWSPEADLLIFDEVHKYPKWKSMLKGIWDTRPKSQRIIVTGSARMDLYRRGGDSLQGRTQCYRLHPFSLQEIVSPVEGPRDFPEGPPKLRYTGRPGDVGTLMRFGGFPEPFLSRSLRTLKRWHRQRLERVFREDIRDTEIVRSLAQVEILGALLPQRVGSPVSLASLASDVECSPKSVRSWLELLCRNYYAFRVPPYSRRMERALKKESKFYLWDWSEVPDEGARFENLVGSHLLKHCHYCQDAFGLSVDLFYLRDLEKREVDFLVTWEGQPWLAVECKLSPGGSLRNLCHFAERLEVANKVLVTLASGVDHLDKASGIRILSAERFLTALV